MLSHKLFYLKQLRKKCHQSGSSFRYALFKLIFLRFQYGRSFVLHQNVKVRGFQNITTNGILEVGVEYVGFMHPSDKTVLNIYGKLNLKGSSYSIGRGCRFDIGPKAEVNIGEGGYINCNTKVIIHHHLSIGDNCVISWDCQFLDEDFHTISYQGKKDQFNGISIGSNVWIGCGVKIYKGTIIPDNTVIASDSIVKGVFTETGTLIGGNPARVIKQHVSWS